MSLFILLSFFFFGFWKFWRVGCSRKSRDVLVVREVVVAVSVVLDLVTICFGG